MRDLLIILGVSVAAILIAVLLFFFGPVSLRSDVTSALNSGHIGTQSPSFVVLEQGDDAISIDDRTNYRITSQADLQALWPIIYGERDAPPIPAIDFSKYEVLAIFDGTHSTGGYGIQVTGIVDNTPVRTITIEHLAPPSTCAVAGGPSSPFELIRVPKTASSLAHQDITGTSVCSSN